MTGSRRKAREAILQAIYWALSTDDPASQTLQTMVLRADLHETVLATKDRMVRTPRWKLLHIPGRTQPIYRLYDMKADPGQTRDLSGAGLPVMPKLIKLLDSYWRGEGASQRWPATSDDAP